MGDLLVERLSPGPDRDTPNGTFSAVPGTGRVMAEPELTEMARDIALAHAVARRPADARVHIERVNHHLSLTDTDGVYGALVDLFIAFDERGAGLRRRMLLGARAVLDADRFHQLEPCIEAGLGRTEPIEPALWSVLSAGVSGRPVIEVVTPDGRSGHEEGEPPPAGGPPATERDIEQARRWRAAAVLDASRAAVRRGERSFAVQVLEAALLEDPGNDMVRAALIDLYRVGGDAAPVRALAARLPADERSRTTWNRVIEELSA